MITLTKHLSFLEKLLAVVDTPNDYAAGRENWFLLYQNRQLWTVDLWSPDNTGIYWSNFMATLIPKFSTTCSISECRSGK